MDNKEFNKRIDDLREKLYVASDSDENSEQIK